MCRIALRWVVPMVCVQAEEELDILHGLARFKTNPRITYAHVISEGTIHIPKKKITKLHRV